MVKKGIISDIIRFSTSVDGYNFYVPSEIFLDSVTMEFMTKIHVIEPKSETKIRDLDTWKRLLSRMVIVRMGFGMDLYVKLLAKPSAKGHLCGFVFDAFAFNNVTELEVLGLRKMLSEYEGVFYEFSDLQPSETLPLNDEPKEKGGIWLSYRFC